jgi:hypothetical protein
MIAILRAFAWLRWRVLLNSFERAGSRDVIERFSGAVEQLAPVMVALLMVPSAVILAGAGAYAGWALATTGGPTTAFQFLRFVLFAVCVLAILGPVLLPSAGGTNAVRLLLLPIPRPVLYLGQLMSTLADPWILLAIVVILTLPFGLLAGGAAAAAVTAMLAAVCLALALSGLALIASSAVQLIVRNRRRGELLALVFILIVPVLGMLPGLLQATRPSRDRAQPRVERQERGTPAWLTNVERGARAVVPSELYAGAVRSAAARRFGAALLPLLALAAGACALHGVAFTVFGRVLASPGLTGSTEAGAGVLAKWRVPGVSPATSAVAVNQLRLALRTPRGRSIVLAPFVVFAMFAAVMLRSRSGGMDLGPIQLHSGVGLAAFSSFVAVISILPIAVNQFATDRAGLTLAMLVPLDTRTFLAGKAIGNALVAAMPATACFLGALVLFPSGHPALWLSVPLSLVAIYLPVAPLASALSAVFPRAVDLNSVGRRSDAHAGANILGMLAFAASGAPCLFLTLLASKVLDRPALAPVFLVVWCAFCALVSALSFRPVRALFERRRENLLIVS